jgi:hypothetical protein
VFPRDGEVLHFSEDPTIEIFVPHVAATAQQSDALVWAVGADRVPDYWFPRQCPRALAWLTAGTVPADRDLVLGAGGATRVHVIEYAWLEAMRSVELYAYRLPARRFAPVDTAVPHAVVSTEPVRPLGRPERVGDLFARHDQAGIELRVVSNLWPFWDVTITTTLGYSGIRLRNARPRTHP